MKILIVEDDRDLAEVVRSNLASKSNTVEVSSDGADGSFLARSYDYDAVILDYSLPKKDGIAVCREMRGAGRSTPIIFLSMTEDPATKVAALDAGADDYMTKPFSLDELYARLKALTRRPAEVKEEQAVTIADLTLDRSKHSVTRGDTPIQLTRKEFSLLEYMMRHPGIVLSRAMIMEHVWTADSDPFSNTVEAHIRNIRKKINVGGRLDMIANVAGRGYIIDRPENLSKF